jgi:hypothetical protein
LSLFEIRVSNNSYNRCGKYQNGLPDPPARDGRSTLRTSAERFEGIPPTLLGMMMCKIRHTIAVAVVLLCAAGG